MRVTIIPATGSVVKNDVGFDSLTWNGTPSDVHALQWFTDAGWIEFIGHTKPNETISMLPDWANNALSSWEQATIPKPVTAEQNKSTASALLYGTDWTTIPDVSDPAKSNPYLMNVDEFVAYRNQLRQIAINPPSGDIVWPVAPVASWSI